MYICVCIWAHVIEGNLLGQSLQISLELKLQAVLMSVLASARTVCVLNRWATSLSPWGFLIWPPLGDGQIREPRTEPSEVCKWRLVVQKKIPSSRGAVEGRCSKIMGATTATTGIVYEMLWVEVPTRRNWTERTKMTKWTQYVENT